MDRTGALLCVFAIAAAAGTADAATCDHLDAATWLLGEWVAQAEEEVIVESWRAASPDTFEGTGETRTSAGGKVAATEVLRLVRMAENVFYVAKVAHNPYPVSFRLVDCPAGRLVFENPLHDFPRKLEYTLLDDVTMTVAVSDGAGKGFTLRFRRQGDSRP